MNYVNIQWGLGNQMFQYAFYLALKHRGMPRVRIIHRNDPALYHWGYELKKVFGIRERSAYAWFLGHFRGGLPWRTLFCSHSVVTERHIYHFDEDMLDVSRRRVLFDGYWQAYRYLEGIGDEVRKAFTFDAKKLNESTRRTAGMIRSCNAVSVHVRRGDYTTDCRMFFGDICTEDYYNRALASMRESVENPRFFVFSDDKEWAREHFQGPEFCVVEGNDGAESWQDMYLMSLCRHNIIANSSFSWWGAWLNGNAGKKVIAPKGWRNDSDADEFIPQDWLRL